MSNAFVKYDPPIVIEIEHVASKARRRVRVFSQHRQVWSIEWEMVGMLGFNTTTGQGTAEARGWIIPKEYMRTLRNDPNFEPAPGRTWKPRVTAPKVSDKQTKIPGF